MATNSDHLMTFNEAKGYLRTSRATLYRFAVEGVIPAFKMVGRWRFKKSRLDQWLESQENTKPKNLGRRKTKIYA